MKKILFLCVLLIVSLLLTGCIIVLSTGTNENQEKQDDPSSDIFTPSDLPKNEPIEYDHVDTNNDGKCDVCDEPYHTHMDSDEDDYCDLCGAKARYLLPMRISVESFETYFLKPLIERFYELLKEATEGTENASKVFNFLDEEAAAENKYQTYVDGCLNLGSTKVTRTYGEGESATRVTIEQGLARYLTNMLRYAGGTAQYDAVVELNTDIKTLLANYSQINVKAYENQPARQSVYDKMVADYYSDKTLEISSTYEPFYLYTKADTDTESIFREDAALMKKCADLYADEHKAEPFTFLQMLREEVHFGFVSQKCFQNF